jgi:hypothetical protein
MVEEGWTLLPILFSLSWATGLPPQTPIDGDSQGWCVECLCVRFLEVIVLLELNTTMYGLLY